MSKGTPDIPWYVHEIPTIMISLRSPFHLFDAPMVKTYINAYDKNLVTIDALIEKMMGRDTFVGKSSVDAFCWHPEIKYE
jgi:beta-N-acetylhexosaminidase